MTRLFFALLTLFFLSGLAIRENSDFRHCTVAAKSRIITGSGRGLDIQPAQFVRDVAKGEKFSDLVSELKSLQFRE